MKAGERLPQSLQIIVVNNTSKGKKKKKTENRANKKSAAPFGLPADSELFHFAIGGKKGKQN